MIFLPSSIVFVMNSTQKRLKLSTEDITYMYDLEEGEIDEGLLQFALNEIFRQDKKVEDNLSVVRMVLYPFRQTLSEKKAEERKLAQVKQ